MQRLATDEVITDTLTITHVPCPPELKRLQPGTELRWSNDTTDHHITVVDGTCRVLGRRIHAGGYAYVPAGIDHAVRAGAWGCTLFSLESVNQAL